MNTTQVIDLVNETVTFARRRWIVRIVICATDIDALRRAYTSAQLTADALFHAIFVAIQDVTAMQALWLFNLLVLGVAILFTEDATA